MEVWELLSRWWEGRKKKKNLRKPFGKPQNIVLLKDGFPTSLLASFPHQTKHLGTHHRGNLSLAREASKGALCLSLLFSLGTVAPIMLVIPHGFSETHFK